MRSGTELNQFLIILQLTLGCKVICGLSRTSLCFKIEWNKPVLNLGLHTQVSITSSVWLNSKRLNKTG